MGLEVVANAKPPIVFVVVDAAVDVIAQPPQAEAPSLIVCTGSRRQREQEDEHDGGGQARRG